MSCQPFIKKINNFPTNLAPIVYNFYVYDTASWNYVLNAISEGGDDQSYVIEVYGDVGVPGSGNSNTFANVSNIQVTLKGEGKLYLTSQGHILYFSGQTVYIDSADLTLEGLANNTSSLVQLHGLNTKLELRNGTITNNTSSSGFGGVYQWEGSFTMSGGSISGNTNTSGGGGVHILGGSFAKLDGGILYGDDAGANSNAGTALGHAVFYVYYNAWYCRDTTLYENNDLSTSDQLPANVGDTLNGWTRRN